MDTDLAISQIKEDASAHFIFVFAMVYANAFPMVNTKKCAFAMLGT